MWNNRSKPLHYQFTTENLFTCHRFVPVFHMCLHTVCHGVAVIHEKLEHNIFQIPFGKCSVCVWTFNKDVVLYVGAHSMLAFILCLQQNKYTVHKQIYWVTIYQKTKKKINSAPELRLCFKWSLENQYQLSF